jgi:hypothetical protein
MIWSGVSAKISGGMTTSEPSLNVAQTASSRLRRTLFGAPFFFPPHFGCPRGGAIWQYYPRYKPQTKIPNDEFWPRPAVGGAIDNDPETDQMFYQHALVVGSNV